MTPELVKRFEGRVPRYTSYPTAPHFTSAVDEATYREWLGQVRGGTPTSVYLHVPFCSKLCWYCGCHTAVVHSYDPVATYRDMLVKEIGLVADALGARPRIAEIHWGGGTPTMLSPQDFLAVTAELRRRLGDADGARTAVEIDPRTLTLEMVVAFREAGVRRASLGVQDFRREVQAAVNRVQSFETTAQAVEWLRAAGIDDINIDLIYGLPHQTPQSVVETVDRVIELEPDRLALFGYAHVPWMKRHQRLLDETTLPGPLERWHIFEAASRRLKEHGFVAIGLDHFAAKDSELARAVTDHAVSRNFQGYTTDAAEALIGFGASAIGTLPQGYVQNAVPIRAYEEAIAAGKLAAVRGVAVGREDRLRRAVIERLMCDLAVDLGKACRAYGFVPTALDAELARLRPFVADGLLEIEGRSVAVREEGRPLVRSIAAVFDAYYREDGEARHSQAV
jgi:oxygen-independent coproporphyrinogen-3 oxidase